MPARERQHNCADTEDELRVVKERFTQALNSSQHILYRLNVKKGGYDYLSPLFEQITGYGVAEFSDIRLETLRDYFHPDDREAVFGRIERESRKRTSSEVNFELEYRFRKKDGSYCWLHDINTACFDEYGNLECFFGSARDVTERRETEDALRRSEEKYREIFEKSPIGIFQSTIGGRFISVNPRLAQLFAYDSPEEMIKSVTDIPEQLFVQSGQRDQIVNSAMSMDDYAIGEVDYCRKDGSTFLANLYMRAVHDDGGNVQFVEGFVEDITERRNAENQLIELNSELERRVIERTAELEKVNARLTKEIEFRKKAQDEVVCLNEDLEKQKRALESANQELESFSYTVSHDLRAPLRRIGEFCKIMEEDFPGKIDDVAKGYLQRINLSAARMDGLVSVLLNLSHISRAEMALQRVNLSEIAGEILEELFRSEPARKIELNIESGVEVEADPGLIRVVLDNLLGNSWKYTAMKSAAIISFGSICAEGKRVFFVRDNGAGFDMEFADQLFTPFHRLHDQEFEGIGIGLATVKRIILRHGGSVWAESVPNEKTTFFFTLD